MEIPLHGSGPPHSPPRVNTANHRLLSSSPVYGSPTISVLKKFQFQDTTTVLSEGHLDDFPRPKNTPRVSQQQRLGRYLPSPSMDSKSESEAILNVNTDSHSKAEEEEEDHHGHQPLQNGRVRPSLPPEITEEKQNSSPTSRASFLRQMRHDVRVLGCIIVQYFIDPKPLFTLVPFI